MFTGGGRVLGAKPSGLPERVVAVVFVLSG
jgi:hypothetical protein